MPSFRHECVSAALPGRSQRANLPSLQGLADATEKGMNRSSAWFHLAAELPARLWPACPSIHVKVTCAWPYVCAGAGLAMPPTSAIAAWNTDQMPGPSPAFHFYDQL
jgi:hypothetical protein